MLRMLRLMLSLIIPAGVWACSCVTGGPPCQDAWKADAVFVGTVSDIHVDREPAADAFLRAHFSFEVNERLLGMEGRGNQLEIRSGIGGGDCGYGFKLGESYLVYAYQNKAGALTASICSRTRPLEQAEADLKYLRSLRKTNPPTFIYGVAGNGEAASRWDQATERWIPEGVPGVTVTLTGDGKTRRLVTGDDGGFRFEPLTPGKYQIALTKNGYSRRAGLGELNVHEGGCAYAWEQLVVDRRITGKLSTVEGSPAAGVQVVLVPRRPDRPYSLPFPVADTKTGADGRYELPNIRPGEYYLGINLDRTPSKDMPYARYFYPGTEDASRAGIVTVNQGPAVETYDFVVPAPQKERVVEGVVYWPDGRPAEGMHIFVEDPHFSWRTASVLSATTDAGGHFKVTVMDGTRYRVHALNAAAATDKFVSAEPVVINPGADVSRPVQLVLTRKGTSLAAEVMNKGLDHWRAGLGLE